ncbi:MAG: type I-E CRISPR-associated protein Cas5/CasD [Thermaerobacter sp.]|nr:type I-E CRISPR-associated protein Cas5/CasD [Thermaerobacter sp.]
MGKTLLILRLEGPMQSWGLRSRWDVRDSGDEPSKSGIVGLLGAALGYPRRDLRLESLDAALRLGVRVERPGTRMVDFQTVSGVLVTANGSVKGAYDDPTTIISPREYLQDAAFLAAMDGPADVLRACADALQRPKWPIFLGRKGCPPTKPVFEELTGRYLDLADAMRRHPWGWEGMSTLVDPSSLPRTLQCYLEDADGKALRPDRIQTNAARMYSRRAVHIYPVPFPGVSSPQDMVDAKEET